MKKGEKKTIRASLQMEGKIYARNNCAQLLVQLIFGRAAWQREGLSLLFGDRRENGHTASPAGLLRRVTGDAPASCQGLHRRGTRAPGQEVRRGGGRGWGVRSW